MTGRVGTIEDIAWRGLRLRLWCFGCGRSRVLDAGKVLQLFTEKGWDIGLPDAALRFPCRRCRSAGDVMILPARPPALEAPDPAPPPPPLTWADEVARFFHANRGRSKLKSEPDSTAFDKFLVELAKKKGPEHRPGPRKKRIEDLD